MNNQEAAYSDAGSSIYSPPKSEVESIHRHSGYEIPFVRFSAWWVFLLFLVTLGLYSVYWLYSRSLVLNSRFPEARISNTFLWVTVITYIASVLLGVLSGFLMATEFFRSNFQAMFYVLQALNWGSTLLWVVWIFKFRNRVNTVYQLERLNKYRFSPGMTLFFNVIYFQFKINSMIDRLHGDLHESGPAAASPPVA